MKIPGFPAVCFVLACATPTSAREVDLLQFTNAQSVEPESRSTSDTRKDGVPVSASLREHFSEGAVKEAHAANMKNGPNNVLVGSRIADLDLKPQRSATVGLACDQATYSSTWWLSPAAEARRSLYFDTVARIACEQGLPTRLLDAVIAQESGYNSQAISSAGAMGMMQIMPGTARSLGLSRPFDPIANMQAGARYLRQQLDRFGRVDLALAAYNAGPERRSLQRGTIPRIPETINYVRTITTNWARLAELGQGQSPSVDRARAAMLAVNASPNRSVELVSYD